MLIAFSNVLIGFKLGGKREEHQSLVLAYAFVQNQVVNNDFRPNRMRNAREQNPYFCTLSFTRFPPSFGSSGVRLLEHNGIVLKSGMLKTKKQKTYPRTSLRERAAKKMTWNVSEIGEVKR